jgi:DNA-binding NtrC family response regulator
MELPSPSTLGDGNSSASEMKSAQTILVIDDDRSVLRLFEMILRRGGYSVLTAESAKRAVEILQSQSVNLAVLDICMPEMDGFEFMALVRAQAPGLRVLAVSGYMDGALLDAAKHLGATASLYKSEAPKQLLSVVNDLLKY